jgi:hypothetical protein
MITELIVGYLFGKSLSSPTESAGECNATEICLSSQATRRQEYSPPRAGYDLRRRFERRLNPNLNNYKFISGVYVLDCEAERVLRGELPVFALRQRSQSLNPSDDQEFEVIRDKNKLREIFTPENRVINTHAEDPHDEMNP